MALIFPLVSKFDDKGIKTAKRELKSFGEGFKKTLGGLGAVGLGFGVADAFSIIKDSVKGAQEDLLGQRLLADQLKITTHARKNDIASMEKFISKSSLATGVVDDKLRPALATLVRTTGSTSKATKLLNTALDISAKTGKPLESVTSALAKAYAGNDKSLRRMLPGLSKTGDVMKYVHKNFDNARLTLSDPFARLDVAVNEAKESLGRALLPTIQNVVAEITKPGGIAERVGKFFDDMSNPKTDVGKAFHDLKKAMGDTMGTIGDFFKQFDPKKQDGMVGFTNVLQGLVKALPAILALKGAFIAMAAVKNIMGLITLVKSFFSAGQGVPTSTTPGTPMGAPGGGGKNAPMPENAPKTSPGGKFNYKNWRTGFKTPGSPKASPEGEGKGGWLFVFLAAVESIQKWAPAFGSNKDKAGFINSILSDMGSKNRVQPKPEQKTTNNHITVHVTSNDPNAVVDALKKYTKTNGPLPKTITGK